MHTPIPSAHACTPPPMELPPGGISIKPSQRKWRNAYDDGFITAITTQAHWYRMREQREHGWRNEPLLHFVRLNAYDANGRLWQCAAPATVDCFGDLVEVRQ